MAEDRSFVSATQGGIATTVGYTSRNQAGPNLLRELVEGPCEESPETGVRLTPGLCAAAMNQGYLDFAASDDFPDELPPGPGS
jgi:hypothetical protein